MYALFDLKALLKLTAGGNRVDNQMSAAASNADQKDTDVKEAIENSYGSTVTNKKVEPEPCCIMSQAQILSTISIEQAFAALTGSRLTRLHIKSELVRRKQQQQYSTGTQCVLYICVPGTGKRD